MTFSSETYHILDAADGEASETLHAGNRTSPISERMSRSPLKGHLRKADDHLDKGNLDCAARELESAAERLMSYQSMVDASMKATISHLTTLGCHATAPHPKALQLIRLRQKL